MTADVTAPRLREALAEVDLPASRGRIEEALAERDLVEDPVAVTADAIEAGTLVEEGEGTFGPRYTVEDPDSDASTPTPETGETTEQDGDTPGATGPLADGVAKVDGEHYPPEICERDVWVNWILDDVGRKRPVAPWETGHAYPVEWSGDLPDEDRPETAFETAKRWADFPLTDLGLELPEDAQSDRLETGIILPLDRPPREERFTLIDWDDVRDPNTGEIHPVAAEYIAEYGGYVEVSTSGEGLHQYVTGGLRKRGKFIAPIDDEPFVGDDLPQVEMYDGGRHVAMTGRHVEGSDGDAVEGQELIDAIVTEFAGAEKDAGHRRYDPETGEADADANGASDPGGDVPEPDTGDYDGPPLARLRETQPDDRPLRYHAAVFAFYTGGGEGRGYTHVLNWRLEGFAAALGEQAGLSPQDVKDDLAGAYLDELDDVEHVTPHNTDHRVDYAFDRATHGRLEAPSTETLVEYGVLPPAALEDDEDDEEEHRADPLDAEAVFAPRRAWEAAGAVDLDPLGLPDAPDVVRAVAIAEGEADDVAEASQLDGEDYFRLYELARTEYDADLPIYVDATRAVDDFEAARAAVEHLKGWHILDELKSEITVENPGGEALAKINPTWEESESGERIIAFDSGLFWCAEHDTVIDPLRVVALENGLIDGEEDTPTGQTYLDAYELARTEYDAPLPRIRWLDSDVTPDPDAEVVLPPADELVGEFTTDRDGLDAWRDRTEDLYRDLADDASRDTVLTAEPSTGKSTAAVKTAVDKPTLLLAPRREMQAEYLAKANDEELFDGDTPSAYILPVFSEPWEGVSEEAVDAGVGAVREVDAGLDLLKDGDALRAAVEERLDANDTLEAPEPDEDVTILDRATDDTAAGEYGLEWALRASVAHRLGLRPQTIHERDTEIFGEPLPCHHTEAEEEDRTCSYTEAYDLVTDPERPIDLLIGSRVHANVESAKTYHYMEDETPRKRPRVVAIDEDPVGDYQTLWEDDARHVATWLGRVLVEDVEDGVDLQRQADTLRDSWVNRWLREDGAEALADMHARVTVGEVLAQVAAEAEAEDVGDIRAIVGEEGAPTTAEAVTALEDLLDTRRRELSERTDQLLRWLSDEGKLSAVKQLPEDEERPLASFDLPEDVTPDTAFVSVVNRAFDALAEGWDLEDGDTDRLVGEFHTAADVVEGGEDAVLELVVAERSGYAHPDAHLLLAGALGGGEPLECHTELLPNREEPGRANFVEVGRSRVSYDRDGEGAVVFDPPAFEVDAGRCSVVGLDATAEKVLWWVFTGLEVDTVSPFDSAEERREFVRDTRNIQVVQTDTRDVNTYSGDPTSKSFAEDLALVEEVAEKYGGRQLRRDSLTSTGDPAVISTKKALDYLGDDLEEHASETENYWNFTGSNALGDHNIGVVLGATHPGDAVIERAAVGAGETIDPQGHGPDKTYGGEVADAMLRYVWEHQITQAVHRFGREEDGAIVFAHSAAVDDDRLPVEGVGGALTAWSDAGKAVRDAMLPYLRVGAEFTVGDLVDEVDYGRRAVQKKLAEFERLGYVDRTVGGPGRANVFDPVEDPGERGDLDLPGGVSGGVESEQPRNTIQYTGSFGILAEPDASPGGATPASGTLPAPATATAGPARGDPGG